MATVDRPISLMLNAEGRIIMASSSASELLVDPAFGGGLEGRSFRSLVHSPSGGMIDALLGALHEEGSGCEARLRSRLIIAGEGRIEAELFLSRPSDSGSAPGRILVGIEPLGAPERAEATIHPESNPALAGAVASGDAVFICRGVTIEEIGDGLSAMVGLRPGALAGWRVQSLVAAEDLLPVMSILQSVQSGVLLVADFSFALLRAGDESPTEVSGRARRMIHNGEPAVLVGLRDVSDSMRAAQLAASRIQDLDAALASTREAVLVVGDARSGWPVIIMSRMFEQMFDLVAPEWLGHSFEALCGFLVGRSYFTEADQEALRSYLKDPGPVRVDLVPLAGSRGRVLERFVGPVRDSGGLAGASIITFRDVSARVEAEAELLRTASEARLAHEDLEALHEELRLANEGLEKRMTELQRLNRDLKVLDEMKSNLLANVSHELQTPLVSVKGFTEMILKRRLGEITSEQERGLSVALRNVNRLIGMIEDLLAFARGQEASEMLRVEVFPLRALLDEAVELVRERAQARRISITTSAPPGDLLIRADRDRVMQVMLNLLTNAVKYNKDAGEVAIEAASGKKGFARVEVRDSGIGIPREDLDRIFDRYFQAGNVEGKAEGSGIGLSITKNLLRQHGCMIRADSEEGKGSVFSFTLPLDRKARFEKTMPRFSGGAALPVSHSDEPVPEPSRTES